MAKVCVGCGLKTNSDGQLITNVQPASAWPFTDCTPEAGGQQIFCSASGEMFTSPEKFEFFDQNFLSHGGGQITSAQFGSPPVGDSLPDTVVPNPPLIPVLTYVNPSSCRSLRVIVEFGIDHALCQVVGSGYSNWQYGLKLTATGNITSGPLTQVEVHQHWGHSGNNPDRVVFDSQGALIKREWIVAPGGTINFALQPYINVNNYNGSTSMSTWRSVINVDARSI